MEASATGAGGRDVAQPLLRWVLDDALPFWARNGVDRRHGGFFEQLHPDGSPIEEPRRARLVARQIYCFATGHELGWDGPAAELVGHGLDFLTRRLLTDDGTILGAVDVESGAVSGRYDPYDYAFVLFALATAARRLGDRDRLHELALRIRERLVSDYAHPLAGFEEARPRSLPLKANPHMHLFEAFLAWDAVMGTAEPSWRDHADRIARLALERMILPESGALPEFYDGDWRPTPDERGLQIEPGHQFEWAWLLLEWLGTERDGAVFAAVCRLAEIGEAHGICADREVAFGAIDEHFVQRDPTAKLWPQTERLKIWHVLSSHPMAPPSLREAARIARGRAEKGLLHYLDRSPAGIWHEVMAEDGSFPNAPVRASSLYHVVCAASVVAGKASPA